MQQELYQVAFRKKLYADLEHLRAGLDAWRVSAVICLESFKAGDAAMLGVSAVHTWDNRRRRLVKKQMRN